MTLVFDIGGSSIKVAVVDDGLRVVERLAAVKTGPVDELERVVLDTIRARPAADRVAVSTTGEVDADGIVKHSGFVAGYAGTSWAQLIEAAFPGRFDAIAVANDGRCAAWGEFVAGHGQAQASLSHFVLGTGLGGGAVVDGVLLRDPHGFAGNFGHVVVMSDDPTICGCGQGHCVETVAATRGVVRHAGRGVTIPELSVRLRDGDAAAAAAFATAGRWLGYAIADVADKLGTDTVTLGGGLVAAARSDTGNVYVDGASASARELSARPLGIVESELGNDAALLGAAALARDQRGGVGRG